MVARRDFLVGAMALVSAAPIAKAAALSGRSRSGPLKNCISELERRSGGRLGVALIDTGSHRRFDWRGDERFPLASTFKFLLAAQMLSRADRGEERLDRRLPIRESRLGNSPFTKSRVGRDASLGELCKAIVEVSDNDAANLLLAEAGGTAAVNRFARVIGDPVILARPQRAGARCGRARRSARHDLADGDGRRFRAAAAGIGASSRLAGDADRMAGRSPHGRPAAAGGDARGLADRPQDGNRHAGHVERRRHPLAGAAPAFDPLGLPDRVEAGRVGTGPDHRRRRPRGCRERLSQS